MSFEIENGVLEKCIPESGETEVVIPDGVTSIGAWAFAVSLRIERCWRTSPRPPFRKP